MFPKTLLSVILFLVVVSPTVLAWDGIIVHHTDSDHMTLEECNDWHNARGWEGCGYNFIIQRNGEIQTARGFERQGAHCRGQNDRFLGIAFIGKGRATEEQLSSFRRFLLSSGLPIGIDIRGHKDFAGTECPGQIMDQLRGDE